MADLNDLKNQRKALKNKFTRFVNFLNDYEKKPCGVIEVKLRLAKIENILELFESVQTAIDDKSKEESDELENFENLYFSNISRAKGFIEQENLPAPIRASTVSTQSEPIIELPDNSTNQDVSVPNNADNGNSRLQISSNRDITVQSNNNIRLPKIELATFDGSFDKWLDFYNYFQSMVHDNSELGNVQKLHYLRSCLKGEAISVINALESTDENYSVAWELLKNRFDNRRIIIQNHVKTLMDLPNITKESAYDLRKLIDQVQTHLRALKSLGEPVNSWDTILIYIITQKNDRNTHKEWERSVTGTNMPAFQEFIQFLESRCQILQVTSINTSNTNHLNLNNKSQSNKKHSFVTAQKTSNLCLICKGSHKIYLCEKFKSLNAKERAEKIKANKLCFNCFKAGHRNVECQWSGCKKCGKKHNTMLHMEETYPQAHSSSENNDNNEASVANISLNCNTKSYNVTIQSQILLSTALINIKGKDGKFHEARVLLDSGSQSNFITEEFSKKLNLPLNKINVPVEGLNQIESRIKNSVESQIYSRVNNYNENLVFLLIPNICNLLPNQFINIRNLQIPKNIRLADPEFYKPNKIDALIGNEIFYDLLSVGQIDIPNTKAKLTKTKLGWIISGKIQNAPDNSLITNCMVSFNSLNNSINKFWEIEEFDKKHFLSEEEYQAEEHFKQNTRRDDITGRYIVRLPFKENISKLGDSFAIAEKQFRSLERKLGKNPKLKNDYIQLMRESIDLKHMREIEDSKINKNHCFLPHHPVIKESSSTTKVRIVFNASAKTDSGLSLNDCLNIGPVVQDNSFNIILRFRTHQIVMLADIEKMYKQIHLDPNDSHYQLCLWRENETDKLKTYTIPVVLFGNAAAPYLATRVIKQLAEDEKSKYPIASKILKRDCYVDDIMTGAENIIKAIELRDQLIQLTNAGGFCLRKWISNVSVITDSLPKNLTQIDLLPDQTSETKALGIQWNNISDEISYKIDCDFNLKITKRNVLSNIAKIYDPIGLIGPVVVYAKIIMQNLWKTKLHWDESLPRDLHHSWQRFQSEFKELQQIKFSRKVIVAENSRIQIHGFCDASEKAYGACVYLRSVSKFNQICTNLLVSKNRVAPLKMITLPKLELCAALLLSRLIKTVLEIIDKEIEDVFLWSDSSITIQWINMQPYSLKTFVANRVSEIREMTSTMRWRHVPSEDNIADILSRGQLPSQFINNVLWKSGPLWLSSDPSAWPNTTIENVPIIEIKTIQVLNAIVKPNELVTKFSSINKLKRVVAYILRFKNNCLNINNQIRGSLTLSELNGALKVILRIVQGEAFFDDRKQLQKTQCVNKRSFLRGLSPFIDEDFLIRVGGRLNNSLLSYNEKHPIILPKGHHVTDLIINYYHVCNAHSGTQTTLNAVRAKFWPLNGTNSVKRVIRNCITCLRAKPKEYSPFMGNLPRDRVIPGTRPFLNTGLDFCGPFYIKEKKHRNRNKVKIYVCIFICFVSKAVHIELISDLTTDSFIGGMRRFIARRGVPIKIYSDNATNFVGANNEFKAFHNLIHSQPYDQSIKNFLISKQIEWHFIPPRSPHFGGLWEASVKSFKRLFIKTVGNKLFTFEELYTYTTEIEGILNSRPITPLSNNPNDLRALTPAHFLIGEALTNLPDVDLTNINSNRLSSWQHIQYVKQQFWRRWAKEYLNQLTNRTKWQIKQDNDKIRTGALILLKEDQVAPYQWPLGRIIEVFPGEDGVIRVVKVQTNSGTYKRAITRVAPLSIE